MNNRNSLYVIKKVLAYLIAVILAVGAFSGCSREPQVEVDVESHLQDTLAGKWLTEFHLSYDQGAPPIKQQIADILLANGTLLTKYSSEENGNNVTTFFWRYNGKTIREQVFKGGIWGGPKVHPEEEYYSGELLVWFTLDLGERGILYSELLPRNYQDLKESRKIEHAATIKSGTDHARLFLFGYGDRCTRISLF